MVMTFSYNPNDPMCRSVYMESFVPTIGEIVNGQTPDPLQYQYYTTNPNSPQLRPQPEKDGYYSSDGRDDGRISTFEKLKAFVKGGTYNMVRGMFCDKDGFSLGRTLATVAGATAIALSGPIGIALASGLGLICAFDNFNNSRYLAKTARTDKEARQAYEGYGESATTAGLSLWGGFKSFKALKSKFFGPKPNTNPPTQPTQPTQPVQPTQPSQPSQPTQPAQPVQPVQPTSPTQTTNPTPSTQVAQPTTYPAKPSIEVVNANAYYNE